MRELAVPNNLTPIEIASLCANVPLEFDLFMRTSPEQPPVLYRERHYPLEADEFRALSENGVQTLYIAERAAAAYEDYVRKWALPNRVIPPTERYKIIRTISRAGHLQSLQSDCCDRMVQAAVQMAEALVDAIIDDDMILSDLFRVMQHDFCTFIHAANVAVYCLALSPALGISERSDLTAIAVGALLHDIGKRKIPHAILNKPGKLTRSEMAQVKKHPRDGFDELADRADLNWGQLMMVYQHHEHLDGRGYPVGVEQDELHPWAQICAVADVFDALTSERPYRAPMSVGQALAFLQRKSGTQFNAEIVTCWIQTMTRNR